jgi:4a-hydroxytetrahydrobiopterin dehydratase
MSRRYESVSSEQFQKETGIEHWEYVDTSLVANFHLSTFAVAGDFASAVAALADEVDHHPDIDIRYPGIVTIHASTHVTKGVSDADVELARAISNLYKSIDS